MGRAWIEDGDAKIEARRRDGVSRDDRSLPPCMCKADGGKVG